MTEKEAKRRGTAGRKAKGVKSAPPSASAPVVPRPIGFGRLSSLIGYQIRRVNGRSITLWEELLSGRGVAWGQYSVLEILSVNPDLVQKDIAAVAGVDQSTVVPVIKHLEKTGLIERTRGTQDGRNVHVRLSRQGAKLLARVDSLVQVHDRELTINLTPDERATLLALLAKISGLELSPGDSQDSLSVRVDATEAARRDAAEAQVD